MGDPIEPTPEFIQRALADALPLTAGYPRAPGPARAARGDRGVARAAVRRGRRSGARADPDLRLEGGDLPLPARRRAGRTKDVVADPRARLSGVRARRAVRRRASRSSCRCARSNAWLPDLDAIDDETWERCAIFWINYPHNPTGAVAPLPFYEELAERARAHGFYLASDEAYTELWFDEPPGSAVQLADRTRVVVFQTLSKRSSMTGYRSGFVCAEPELIDALRSFRPNAGTAPQEFVQRASVAAWNDEAHVEETRARYARKRELLAPLLDLARAAPARRRSTSGSASLPASRPSRSPTRLLEHGVVVAPGSFFGPSGEGYARLALVPSLEECERAASILREAL